MGNSEAKKKKRQEQQLKQEAEKQKKINIAILFLEGQNIKKIPIAQKKLFLRKKGLTLTMIQEAFNRYDEKQKVKQNNHTEVKNTIQPTVLPPVNINSPQKKQGKTQDDIKKTKI